jgi:hypothetical protein
MSRALVAIGVSQAGDLTPLPGAADDASEMYNWAVAEGFQHVKLLTDRNGPPVTFQDIYDAVQGFLAHGDLEQLIVYFSGHGYSPAPQIETLLLTGWNTDPNEAINLSYTVLYAQSYASPQISIIVDACRTTWATNAPILGQVILKRPPAGGSPGKVDEFYATRFGFPSQEADQANGPTSFGVFTKELLEALHGRAPEAVERRDGKLVVTSLTLERYLEDAVPDASERIPGAKTQHPQSMPRWRRPTDVYTVLETGTEGLEPLDAGGGRTHRPEFDLPVFDRIRSARTLDAIAAREAVIREDAALIRGLEGRQSFETATGVTVIGARVKAVFPAVGAGDIFEENAAWHVRLPQDALGTTLIQLADGAWKDHWLVVAAFPMRIATAHINDQGFSSLNYRPARRLLPNNALDERSKQMEDALSEATAALLNGVLPTKARAQAIINTLRSDKQANPAFAIVAGHVCQRVGEWSAITDMEYYDIGGGAYTPYDLVLLTGHLAAGRKLVGDCPLMSRGWALLPPDTPAKITSLVRYITPSLWTMLGPGGGAELRHYLETRQ